MALPSLPNSPGVYRILNKQTGDAYVGAARSLSKRGLHHVETLARGSSHNRKLQKSYLTHGPDAFEFSVIEECDARVVFSREQHWIETLKPTLNAKNQNVKPKSQRKGEYIGLRLRSAERQEIDRLVSQSRMNKSEVIRLMLQSAAKLCEAKRIASGQKYSLWRFAEYADRQLAKARESSPQEQPVNKKAVARPAVARA